MAKLNKYLLFHPGQRISDRTRNNGRDGLKMKVKMKIKIKIKMKRKSREGCLRCVSLLFFLLQICSAIYPGNVAKPF